MAIIKGLDRIYSYHTPIRREQKTRYPMDKFIDVLKSFYEKYTNANLEKLIFTYIPRRLSNPDLYEHWVNYNKDSSLILPPLETDENVEKTLKALEKLNILSETHDQRYDPGSSDTEEHIYEIHINSYNEMLKLLEAKNGCFSHVTIQIENFFNFNNYDYSEIEKVIPWCKAHQAGNEIYVYIMNNYFNNKPEHEVRFNLLLPKFSETEKDFLRQIEKELKIHFSRKNFSYYYINEKGKLKDKKEIIDL